MFNNSRINYWLFWCLFAITLVGPVLHSLKVSRISYDVGAYYFYLSFVFSIIVMFICSYRFKVYRSSLPFFIVICFMLIYALFMSWFNSPDLYDFFGDFLRVIFVLLIVGIFSSSSFDFLLDDKMIKRISVFSLVSVLIGVFILYLSYFRGIGVYFGLQSTLALVGLSFGLVYRKYFFVFLSIIIVVLSGKRGVMLSLLAVFFFYFLIFSLSKYKNRIFIYLSLGVLSIITAVYFDMIPGAILNRVSMYFSGDDINWRVATAGRNEEVSAVIVMLSSDLIKILFGVGLGGAFINEAGVLDSTVHISPLAIVFKFGGIGFIAFYSIITYFIIINLIKSVKNSNLSESRALIFWFLVFIGEFTYSFTTFTLLQSFVLWLAFTLVMHGRNFRRLHCKQWDGLFLT